MTFSADSALLGTPQGTPAQCIRFMLARKHGEYTEKDIAETIVPAYFTLCAAVMMEPVMLLAQMIHETGGLTSWWSQRPRRNPAGVGVTGRVVSHLPLGSSWQERGGEWVEGVAFGGWKDAAIPAHVGRLLAYALRDKEANPIQRATIAQALAWRPLPAGFRGAAPTWRGLNGRWAVPGTTYATMIAGIANAIMRA